MTEMTPIVETICQYQELVNLHNAHRAKEPLKDTHLWETPVAIELTRLFDQLMGYMMQEFSSYPCTKEDVRVVFINQPLFLTTDYLESVVRGTIPVLVTYNVMVPKQQDIFINPFKMNNWRPFRVVYSNKIPDMR